MNATDLLKKVRKLEIKTRGLSTRLFSGEYHSAFKGKGMTFAEVRPYQYGDDVRFIDWNVTARHRQPYIKTFEEERELTLILMVDMSRSDDFGTVQLTKGELMAEIAAVLSYSAINNNDKVGVVFFTDRIEKFIPPRKGNSHILRILRDLIDFEPQSKGTQISAALQFLNQAIRQRAIVFMLSDFQDSGYDNELKIAARRHDLIGIRVYDPLETVLPDAGIFQVQDNESGQTLWLDSSDPSVRRQYQALRESTQKYFASVFAAGQADVINVRTDQAYMPLLHAFFRKREKRH